MVTETFQVEYEDLNPNATHYIEYGSTLSAFVELQDKLIRYYSEKGPQVRQINNRVVINEILADGSRIKTEMKTNDLYIVQVTVYDSNKKIIIEEADDGVVGGYNQGTIMIPIQYYIDPRKYSLPGALLRSQAFRISESLRFRRICEPGSGFETEHAEQGRIVTKNITPFQYSAVHRAYPISFHMFEVFYKNWEDLSDKNSPIIAISQKVRKN